MADFEFEADPELEASVIAAAAHLIEFAEQSYAVTLDFSDASIESVEQVADAIYRDRPAADADTEQGRALAEVADGYANCIGAYIGETFRRNHGGRWGHATYTPTGARVIGLETDAGRQFWPTLKARRRLDDGPEDNLWHYYVYLTTARDSHTAEIVGKRGLRARILRSPHR